MDAFLEAFEHARVLASNLAADAQALQQLTLPQLDQLLDYKQRLEKLQWNELVEEVKAIKRTYIDLLQTDQARLDVMFYWKDCQFGDGFKLNDYKKEVIAYVQNESTHAYNILWGLVVKGDVTFDPKDIASLPLGFIKHCLGQRKYRHTQVSREGAHSAGSSDDEPVVNTVPMGKAERFWVSVLAWRDDVDVDAALVSMAMETDPRMHYLPVGVKRFDGELVSQVSGYYDGLCLSPVIKCRRTVGIIVNNTTNSFYNLNSRFANGNVYASCLAVEFPYMCYVFVDRVELDVTENWDKTESKRMFASTGDTCVLQPFVPVESTPSSPGFPVDCKTLECKLDGSMPAYYVSLSLGLTHYNTCKDVRIYGHAVAFC